MAEKVIYRGTGRKKTSAAQVILTPGKRNIIVNDVLALEFSPYPALVQDLEQPLVELEQKKILLSLLHLKVKDLLMMVLT